MRRFRKGISGIIFKDKAVIVQDEDNNCAALLDKLDIEDSTDNAMTLKEAENPNSDFYESIKKVREFYVKKLPEDTRVKEKLPEDIRVKEIHAWKWSM